MSDQEALLAAIRANPDEDTPRLVYADWLDEHATSDADRGRAEFIRVQCESAKELHNPERGLRYQSLKDREKELLRQFRDQWLHTLPKSVRRVAGYRRGFVDSLSLSPKSFRGNTRITWNQELSVGVSLSGPSVELEPIVRDGGLAEIHMSRLSYVAGPGDVAFELISAITAAPFARNLESLDLSGQGLRDASVIALSRLMNASSLRSLSITAELTATGWDILADSQFAEGLDYLFLCENLSTETPDRPGPDGAAALARSPRLSNLKKLWILSQRIGWDGLRAILESRRLASLEELHLSGEDFDVEAMESLGTVGLPNIKCLDLSNCEFSRDAMRAFARSAIAKQIQALILSGSVSRETTQILSEGGPYANLEQLDLSASSVQNVGLNALTRSKAFPALTKLNLFAVDIKDTAASRILNATWADQLKELSLGGNDLTDWMRRQLWERFGDAVRV